MPSGFYQVLANQRLGSIILLMIVGFNLSSFVLNPIPILLSLDLHLHRRHVEGYRDVCLALAEAEVAEEGDD